MEGIYTGVRYVHARAEIEARVWYTKKERVEKTQEVKIQTGEVENKYSIKFNNFQINLFKTLSKFQNYDTMIENKKLRLFSDFYLPVEWKKTTNYEVETKQITYSVNDLKEMNLQRIEDELIDEIENDLNIINKQINIIEQDTYIEIEVICEVLENIGTEEKIVF